MSQFRVMVDNPIHNPLRPETSYKIWRFEMSYEIIGNCMDDFILIFLIFNVVWNMFLQDCGSCAEVSLSGCSSVSFKSFW